MLYGKDFSVFSKIKLKDNMADLLKLDFGADNFQTLDLSGGNNHPPSNIKLIPDNKPSTPPPSFFQPKPTNRPNLDMISDRNSDLGLDLLINKDKQRKLPSPSSSPPSINLGSTSPPPQMNNRPPSRPFFEPKPKVDTDNSPHKLDLGNSTTTPVKELDLDLDLDSDLKPNFNILGDSNPNFKKDEPTTTSSSIPSFFNDSNPSTTFESSPLPETPPIRKTFEQIQKEKAELLRKLERYRKKGYFVYRNFDMNSEVEDIKNEYENVKEEASLQRSLRQQKDVLITTSRFIEGIATHELVQEYTGKLELEGWSQHMMETVDDYEDIMEDLHDRYGKMFKDGEYPEARLLFSVIHSAIMFHITKKYVQQMPNLGNLLNSNPQLAKEFSKATASMVGDQNPSFANMMHDMEGMRGNPMPDPNKMEPRDMQGPSNLDDILSRLNSSSDINLGM